MPQEGKGAETDQSLVAQQAARAELRESFLTALNMFSGQPCKILTYEKTMLQATFAALHPGSQDVLVRDLKTPANISIKCALLRTTDILSIQFDSHGGENLLENV